MADIWTRYNKLDTKIIEEKLNISWGCAARCNHVDEELIMTMKKAGCKFISYGVESLSDKVLETINKGITYKDMVRAKKLCDLSGISFNPFTITGFPNESKLTTLTSITRSILSGIKYDPMKSAVRPYPGTKLWEMAVKNEMVDLKANPWLEVKRIEGKVGNSNGYNKGFIVKLFTKLQKILSK